MIKVVINGRFLDRRTTGVGRFARETLLALDQALHDGEAQVQGLVFEVLVPRDAVCDLPLKVIQWRRVGCLTGQLWEQCELPWYTRRSLLLNLCNTAPIAKKAQVVVIHDAMVARHPAALNWRFRLWYRLLLPILGRIARRVVTVSEFSRLEIAACYRIPLAKTVTISEGAEHLLRVPSDPGSLHRFGLTSIPFVLCVSSQIRYKNLEVLSQSLNKFGKDAPFTLVVAGGSNNKVFTALDLTGLVQIKLLGYVSDGELRALYENAICFVFPSLYEGFGLPVVEAMALGCPVVCSNAASLPEVCRNAALLFDPNDASALAATLRHVVENEEVRNSLIDNGLARVRQLTWAETSSQIASICRENAG